MWRAMWALLSGSLAEAREAVEAFRLEGERWHYADVGQVHAVLALHLGVETGDAGFANTAQDLSRFYTLCLAAEAAYGLGDETAAAALAPLLAPWCGHVVVLGSGALCLGAGDLYAGLAALTAGDKETGAAMIAEAAAANDRLGAPVLAARAKAVLAELEGRP